MTEIGNKVVEWTYRKDVDYTTGLDMQKKLHKSVLSNGSKTDGYLLMVEHKPVITVGRFGKMKNVLFPEKELIRRGVEFHKSERGGDVTFHGHGQLVGYPIINLKSFNLGVKDYVHLLEETLIGVLREFGINGSRVKQYPGVWVGGEKIASIGVFVKNWITMHGFALNVNTDLNYYSLIIPCGISDMGVTSMKKLLGRELSLDEVAECLAKEFGKIFQIDMVQLANSSLSMELAV